MRLNIKYMSLSALAAVILAAGCSQGIDYPVTYNVTLDPGNSYIAGEPVRFNISGDVDNLVFYSGEINHQYLYKDRFSVSPEEINSVKLHIDYQPRNGYANGLSVYITDSFDGLSGDYETDTTMIGKMVREGMPGWNQLEYNEGPSKVWTSQEYDISAYASNFVLAFHWHPVLGTSAQRTYWLNGAITADIKTAPASTTDFTGIDWEAIMLNPEYTQGYYTLSGNPGFNTTKPSTAAIMINGCLGLGGGPDYAHNGWIFTKKMALTSISNDTGVAVKNLQTYMDCYEYVFEQPGVYTVTFVGINDNVEGSSKKVKQLTVNIFPNL